MAQEKSGLGVARAAVRSTSGGRASAPAVYRHMGSVVDVHDHEAPGSSGLSLHGVPTAHAPEPGAGSPLFNRTVTVITASPVAYPVSTHRRRATPRLRRVDLDLEFTEFRAQVSDVHYPHHLGSPSVDNS